MKYRGRYSTPEEFGELVVRSLPSGEVLRLNEVADVELGDEAYNYSTEMNGQSGCYGNVKLNHQKASASASQQTDDSPGERQKIHICIPDSTINPLPALASLLFLWVLYIKDKVDARNG